MSQVIRIPGHLYKRLEFQAKGFDTPANVIERVLDFYEKHHQYEVKTNGSLASRGSNLEGQETSAAKFKRKTYVARANGSFRRDIENGLYTITSPDGNSESFHLPSIDDKKAVQELTHRVEDFVKKQGGTIGQIKSARKKLTEFGYHITK